MIDITATELNGIDFAPTNSYAEILQNVRCIVSTIKGSVPLDRDFGVDAEYLDKPTPKAQAMVAQAILNAIQVYEPRVEVNSIRFTATADGRLIPKVQVKIKDEYET